MDMIQLYKDLRIGVGLLFRCSDLGDRVRIRTPFVLPDGDYIDLYCSSEGGWITVSDLAETTGWLRMQSASAHRSSKQNILIDGVCMTHGVQFHRGMLQTRCRSREELAAAVMRVAQAALRVADLWFTVRAPVVHQTTDDVAAFLLDREFKFDRTVTLSGKSRRKWTVDFRVHTRKRASLVQVLRTANRASAHQVSERVLAAWHDLRSTMNEPRAPSFVSLFDDTHDVWKDEDFQLIESISTVSRWSRQDEFAAVLAEVA